MPYDAKKANDALRIVGAWVDHPGGNFLIEIADLLKSAESEITAANQARLKAEGDANRYATELATIQATIRALREENEALKAAAPKVAPKKTRPAKVVPLIQPTTTAEKRAKA